MARPIRHNAEYFYHPASLRNDRRVKVVRARLGLAGYGLLLMLLEVLTDAPGTVLTTDEMELELLAGDLGVSAAEIELLLQITEKVGFFARTDAGLLHCPTLDEWLAPVFEKRNRTRNAAQTPKGVVTAAETPIAVAEKQPVKESTVKNSKVNTAVAVAGERAAESASQMEVPADEAPVFLAAGFAAFVTKMAYGHIDKSRYLLDIQRKAESLKPRTNAGWENYILAWLRRDLEAGHLLTATGAVTQPSRHGPPPGAATASTSYDLKELAARQAAQIVT